MHMDENYLSLLYESKNWLPGLNNLFNAFNLPFEKFNYLLLGESPYPRAESANGYAFWDKSVGNLWSSRGLSKEVNRATSLRNFIKMLLNAEGLISGDQSQSKDIEKINKEGLIQTNQALFENMINKGFLLLNASLTLETNRCVSQSSKKWLPFLEQIGKSIEKQCAKPPSAFIFLGKIAQKNAEHANLKNSTIIKAEHPYNLSFISNTDVIKLFKPLHLLNKK